MDILLSSHYIEENITDQSSHSSVTVSSSKTFSLIEGGGTDIARSTLHKDI